MKADRKIVKKEDKTEDRGEAKMHKANVSNDRVDRAMFVVNANKDNKADKTEVTEGVGKEVVATAVDLLVFQC